MKALFYTLIIISMTTGSVSFGSPRELPELLDNETPQRIIDRIEPVSCEISDNITSKMDMSVRPYHIFKSVGITYLSFDQDGALQKRTVQVDGFLPQKYAKIIYIGNPFAPDGFSEEVIENKEELIAIFESKIKKLRKMEICN